MLINKLCIFAPIIGGWPYREWFSVPLLASKGGNPFTDAPRRDQGRVASAPTASDAIIG
jgi:hypothetical protein